MNLEGLTCWDDYPMEHGCICGNDCAPPPLPLDPYPWYVEEADEGRPPFGRYTIKQVSESADEGEWGGVVYNLAKWRPRPGYSQNREDYR